MPISLIFLHFIGDFILQSNWMALNKSKNTWVGWLALILHCAVYSACFLFIGFKFAVLTFYFHLITDFFTSRITSNLWFLTLVRREPCNTEQWCHLDMDNSKRHWFFVMIGLDQLVHYLTLALTYRFLYS